MATSAQTRNPRPDGDQSGAGSGSNGQQADETAAQVGEQARATAVETATLVPAMMRQTQDGVLRSVQLWTELMTRLTPFAVLNPAHGDDQRDADPRGDDVPRADRAGLPARAWMDGVFDTAEMLLANQRHYIDQVLAAQRMVVGEFLDAATAPVTRGQRR